MTIRTTPLGGTDWIDGEVLFADDLNDTFDEVINSRNSFELYNINVSGGNTYSTSYVTFQTINLVTLDKQVYSIDYNIYSYAQNNNTNITCSTNMIITFDDDTTDTVSWSGNHDEPVAIKKASYSSSKQIKTIELQHNTSNASYSVSGGLNQLSSDTIPFQSTITCLSLGNY